MGTMSTETGELQLALGARVRLVAWGRHGRGGTGQRREPGFGCSVDPPCRLVRRTGFHPGGSSHAVRRRATLVVLTVSGRSPQGGIHASSPSLSAPDRRRRAGSRWSSAALLLAIAGSLFSLGYLSNTESLSLGRGILLAAILLAPIAITATPVILRDRQRVRRVRAVAAAIYVPVLPVTFLVGGIIFPLSFIAAVLAALRQ